MGDPTETALVKAFYKDAKELEKFVAKSKESL